MNEQEKNDKFWDHVFDNDIRMFWINDTTCMPLNDVKLEQ